MKEFKRVIFVCLTPYHLFNALYYAMNVHWGKCRKILLCHNLSDYKIDLSIYNNKFDVIFSDSSLDDNCFIRQYKKMLNQGHLFKYSTIGKYIEQNTTNNNIVICFNDEERLTHKLLDKFVCGQDNYVILAEEGLHMYVTLHFKRHLKFYISKFLSLILGLKEGKDICTHPLISAVFVQRPDMFLKLRSGNWSVVKQNKMFLDNVWMEKIKCMFKQLYENIHIPQDKPSVLWLGQPLCESGVNENEEISVIISIMQAIGNQCNFIIKRHPREQYDKYTILKDKGAILLDVGEEYASMPMEILFDAISPIAVLSAHSSALFSALNLGKNMLVFFCYKLFNINMNQSYLDELSNYSNMYDIGNVMELAEVIKNFNIKEDYNVTQMENCDIKFLENLVAGNMEEKS